MCTTSTLHRDVDFARIDWEVLVLRDPDCGSVAHYRVTCSDRETGTFIGEAVVPPGPNGGVPAVTVGDVVELVGGYRMASIIVQIEAERLDRINRRFADRGRRRGRSWLRRVPASILAEHGIETPATRRSVP